MKINKKGKKRRGFTLIELLAVIVILAVIALITIYIIGDVIEQAKIKKYYSEEKSMETAAGLYLVKNEGMLDRVIDSQVITLRTLVNSEVMKAVHDSGNGGLCDQDQSKVLVNVDKEKRLVTYTGCLKCSNYQTKNEDCGFVEEVEDKKLCELEEKDGTYYIDSEEDLYAFSKSVNSGNNYSGKTVKLRKNLDMSKSIDTIKTSCGEDVTSFDPIGNNKTSSNRFAGTFEGDGYYIRNLTINKPTDDYVGLFGYSTGVIRGINVSNINITGKNRVGAIVGEMSGSNTSEASVSSVKINGNVTGNNYVGGIVGFTNVYGLVTNFVSNMNVTSEKEGSGIAGTGTSAVANGIIEGGTIVSPSNSAYFVSKYSYSGCSGVYVSSATTLNGTNKPIGEFYCKGRGYPSEYFGRLNGYEEVLDTYIGGDNDGDGYYFDFDNNKNIVVKSTSRNPIPKISSLTKKDGVYQISSIDDWNIAVVYPKENYELTSDLDFGNDQTYMLGGKYDKDNEDNNNAFAGTFEGNGYKIKNYKILGMNNAGLFGYLSGDILGINIENAYVDGYNNVGGLVGNLAGTNAKPATVSDIKINGNVTGNDYVGGIAGFTNIYGFVTSFISNMNVTATKEGSGVVGTGTSAVANGIIEGGTIVSPSNSAYFVSKYSYSGCSGVYVSSATTLNGTNKPIGEFYCKGRGYPSEYFGRLNGYDEVIDTYIGGDNDSNGYYFDYDSSNNIVVKSTRRNPLPQLSSLSGSGTEEDPYKISSVDDYNVAVVYPTGKNYELTADLDFNNKEIYMFGSASNQFTDNFKGNNHKIKNYKIRGMNYTGLFGYVSGKIENLNISGINVDGYNYVGGLAGYISGTTDNPASVNNLNITGTVTGHDNVGGIVGYLNYGDTGYVSNFVSNMIVSGNDEVGGAGGNGANFSGSITGGSITGYGTIRFVSTYVCAGSDLSCRCTDVSVAPGVTLNNKPRSDYGQRTSECNGFCASCKKN